MNASRSVVGGLRSFFCWVTRRPHVIWIGVAFGLALIVACGIWLGVRGNMARSELSAAERLVGNLQGQFAAGKTSEVPPTIEQIVSHIDAAHQLVSDPVWNAAGLLPLLGGNFSTVSSVTDLLHDVAHEALIPSASVVTTLDMSKLKPEGGAIDVARLSAARAAIDQAAAHLRQAHQEASNIRPGFGTVPEVQSGVARLSSSLAEASNLASSLDTGLEVLPGILGSDGPRNYLVLFLNNAELRSAGGIPGAIALVHVDNGRISMVRQTEAKSFPELNQSVSPLPLTTLGLYGAITGRYMQDVTLTPRYPLTATLAAEMWKLRYKEDVDGVLALDPIALSYILRATGPVRLDDGESLTSANAVTLLLSQSYARYSVPEKDGFFASAASAVFTQLSKGSFDAKSMLTAVSDAAKQRRILFWSSRAAEQDAAERAGLSGDLPAQGGGNNSFGIYLNDATGSKMDFYLRESYAVGGAVCRPDNRPMWEVDVALENSAPTDAASSLPRYVTGGGIFGVAPGNIKTQVNVYAPPGSIYLGAADGTGGHLSVHTDADDGFAVTQTYTELAPGQKVTLRFQFLGTPGAQPMPDLVSTPTVNNFQKSDLSLTCQDVVR